LNESILSLLLQAENEYDAAIKNAVKETENYADECRKEQDAYVDGLNRDWEIFEKSETDKLDKTLAETEQNLEIKMAELKNQLKLRQEKKAELISGRLKEEVISLYGNR